MISAKQPTSNTAQQYRTGQIYVERLVPESVTKKDPVIFITGNGQSGTNWLNTPDNREGWASYLLRQGYVVYITDQAQRGRSPWLPGDGNLTAFSTEQVSSLFTAPQSLNPTPYPQAYLHTQWPGSGQVGDETFDAFYASQVPSQANLTRLAEYNNVSYNALLDHIGQPVFLITHSQSGPFGWQIADSRPHLLRGLVSLEPQGPPFEDWSGPPFREGYSAPGGERPFGVTQLAVYYEPSINGNANMLETTVEPPTNANLSSCTLQKEPARKLVNVAKVPVLLVTGEGSYHRVYDYCTARYLRQTGVEVKHVQMGEVGVHGNGHFSFLEKNNMEVLDKVVLPWVRGLESVSY